MTRVCVCGSRDYNDYVSMSRILDRLRCKYDITEIVSGTANGADKLGELYASEHNISIKRFPADWNTYGKRAGYIRNERMVCYSDMVVAFWNGTSRGTMHTINITRNQHKPIIIIKYNEV